MPPHLGYATLEEAWVAYQHRRAAQFKDDRDRFALRANLDGPLPAGLRRHNHRRSCVLYAWACKRAGDEEGFAQWMAKATAGPEEPAAARPPLPFVAKPPDPPESPE